MKTVLSKLRALWLPCMWDDIEELHKIINTLDRIKTAYESEIEELKDEISTLKAAQKIHNKEIGYQPLLMRADLD